MLVNDRIQTLRDDFHTTFNYYNVPKTSANVLFTIKWSEEALYMVFEDSWWRSMSVTDKHSTGHDNLSSKPAGKTSSILLKL